ncbi:MAG: long-chain-fatty-acid--CoA ligase [bacterium]
MKQQCYQNKPWCEHYEPGVPLALEYEKKCLPEFLDASAHRCPDRMALLFKGYTLTFRELKKMVDRFAACLHHFGIRKGDRVSILLPNSIPCVVSYYAVLKVGGIAIMNNPLSSIRELEYQFNDSGSTCLITLDLLANRMIDLRPKTPIRQIIYTSIGDYLPFFNRLIFPLVAAKRKLAAKVKPAGDVYRWKEILNNCPSDPPNVSIGYDDIAMYQYTGGTTGISKGAILTHGNLSVQVQQLAAWFPQFHNDHVVMLGALPFFHVFGLTAAMNFAVYMGWGNILIPKPKPETLIEAIRKYRPVFAPLVPTMYIGILNHPDINKVDMTSIKGCFSGSAPLPVELIREFEGRTGAVIVEGFGLTEASPVTHINPFGGKRKVGSVGLPLPDTECRIVDLRDGKTEVPVGEAGELLIKGPQVMNGYLNRPGETKLTLDDGWLHTGDVARMDDEGYFYIVDRIKDLVLSGGCNVYPRDVEEVLFENPKVKEVAAIGKPHPTRGECVKVFCVLKKGQTATQQELIEFCKGKLAIYKLPTEVEFMADLPKNRIGKILKKDLRAAELERCQKAPETSRHESAQYEKPLDTREKVIKVPK